MPTTVCCTLPFSTRSTVRPPVPTTTAISLQRWSPPQDQLPPTVFSHVLSRSAPYPGLVSAFTPSFISPFVAPHPPSLELLLRVWIQLW
eukprot:226532-Rhodomonas_salina.2